VLQLSEMPWFPEQLWRLLRMRVVVGVHGAGLANMFLMPPAKGVVVEVWHGMKDNYHYQNVRERGGSWLLALTDPLQYEGVAVITSVPEGSWMGLAWDADRRLAARCHGKVA